MLDPMGKKGFDKTGSLINATENVGNKITGGIFNKLFPKNEAHSNNWSLDAKWAVEQQKPIKTRVIIYSIFLTLILLFLWAAFSPLDEVVNGVGKVIPTSGTQVVQSVDGGMVEEIMVHESDTVTKDTVILKIDPTRFSSFLGERKAQVMALMAKAARLEALTRDVPYEPSAEVAASVPDIVEHERRLYLTSLDEIRSGVSVARDRAAQRRQELIESTSRLAQLSTAKDLAQDELNATKSLLESGAVSPLEVTRLEKEVARSNGERDQARAQVSRARSAIQEAEGQIREIGLRFRNAWRNELSATLSELGSLTEGNKALVDRVSHSEVRSPINGTIKRLFVNTVGAVVMPGGAVAEIVSDEDELVVEAKLSPTDRAFVKPGQNVVVKFTAYEYAIYGGLDGTVEYIGPDTITDEKGNTFYTVRIKTNKTSFGENRPILPGMVAQVDIITGKKTVLSYLLKPLFRAKDKALREH